MNRSTRALLAACTCVLASVACSQSGGGGTSTSDPIVIGSIASLSGAGVFPDPGAAAKAVFDDVNAAGGINGRKINFELVDDAGDVAKSAQAARRLVEQDGAVAMAASASGFNCLNAQYYQQQKIKSVDALAILPTCFSTPNIASTTAGPFTGISVSLTYASETLKKNAICLISPKDNGFQQGGEAATAVWQKATGKSLKLAQYIPQTADYQPYILKAKEAGCDATIALSPSSLAVAYEKQFNQAGARATMTSIQLSSAYSQETGAALADVADGIYANAEFLPFTGTAANDPGLKDWRDTMTAHNLPLNSFGQAGYLSAKILVDVLKGIKGDITRDSVDAALEGMAPVTDPLLGNPWVFGPGSGHNANRSSRFVQLKGGVWQPVTTTWTTLSE